MTASYQNPLKNLFKGYLFCYESNFLQKCCREFIDLHCMVKYCVTGIPARRKLPESMDAVLAFEEEFGREVSEDAVLQFRTVGDVVRYFEGW